MKKTNKKLNLNKHVITKLNQITAGDGANTAYPVNTNTTCYGTTCYANSCYTMQKKCMDNLINDAAIDAILNSTIVTIVII